MVCCGAIVTIVGNATSTPTNKVLFLPSLSIAMSHHFLVCFPLVVLFSHMHMPTVAYKTAASLRPRVGQARPAHCHSRVKKQDSNVHICLRNRSSGSRGEAHANTASYIIISTQAAHSVGTRISCRDRVVWENCSPVIGRPPIR